MRTCTSDGRRALEKLPITCLISGLFIRKPLVIKAIKRSDQGYLQPLSQIQIMTPNGRKMGVKHIGALVLQLTRQPVFVQGPPSFSPDNVGSKPFILPFVCWQPTRFFLKWAHKKTIISTIVIVIQYPWRSDPLLQLRRCLHQSRRPVHGVGQI